MLFMLSDLKMYIHPAGHTEIWFVMGYPNNGYPTKMVAESAAKQLHPNVDSNSAVYYRRFYNEQEI